MVTIHGHGEWSEMVAPLPFCFGDECLALWPQHNRQLGNLVRFQRSSQDIKQRKLQNPLHLLALWLLLASRFPNQVDAQEASGGPIWGVGKHLRCEGGAV